MAALPVLTVGGKALLALARSLPTIGATGAVGLTGATIVGRGGQLLGLTPTNDDVADNRGYNLDTDKVEKTGKLGDVLRDITTGTNTAEINKKAKENAIALANNNTQGARLELLQRSDSLEGGLTLEGLKRQSGETAEEMRQRYEREGDKLNVLEYQQLNDLPRVPGQSMAAAVSANEKAEAAKPLSPENRYIDMLERQRQQDAYQMELMHYNERKNDARLNFQEEQAALNRQENLQMRMFDREDRRADRAAADRRADRKERQMLILQMLKGLTNLGGSLTI